MTTSTTRASVLAVTVLAASTLAACAQNAPQGAAPSAPAASVTADSELTNLLPAKVKDSGKLVVGINLTYPPDEFKDPSGAPTGWGVELIKAVAQRLGVTADLRESQFDNIIPGVKGDKYDLGVGSFTDTAERQKSVDFVDYYTAGTQWATKDGRALTGDTACGLTFAVGTGTYQETDELPGISKACVAKGKPALKILKLDTQGDITNAVALGRADAMSADSPVTQYAVKQAGGKVKLSGEIKEAAPFGWAVAKKNTQLRDAVQKAAQSLVDDGTYGRILTAWGVESGAVPTVGVNVAKG